MSKPTGFMDYKRVENGNVDPLVRITNFKEFHPKLDEKARREQAARCMNCGVPMCQSAMKLSGMVTGCPLHNYIPEWNDALYNGQFDMAAWRLLKTSSFPEFTTSFENSFPETIQPEQLPFTTTNSLLLKKPSKPVI